MNHDISHDIEKKTHKRYQAKKRKRLKCRSVKICEHEIEIVFSFPLLSEQNFASVITLRGNVKICLK